MKSQLQYIKLMGNSNNPNEPLQKGEGYRIIEIKENSPFWGKVEAFFDFIIEVIPPAADKSPAQILDKLAPPSIKSNKKSPFQILSENVDKQIEIKIVSTKYRKVRSIQVTPNRQWSNNNDLIGITVRKERYDQAFQTYYPITDIKINSPIKKAGITEGQYILGCLQFPYPSLEIFTQGIYERFFDKQLKDKNIHIAVYDIKDDHLSMRQVTLNRGWGGKGLLGCQFLQGMLNKFPTNLQQQRKILQNQQAKKNQNLKLRNQLGECNGASKLLAQSLDSQKAKRKRHYQNIKNLLNVEPPQIAPIRKQIQSLIANRQIHPLPESDQNKERIQKLQHRVEQLESSLGLIRDYFQEMKQEEIQERQQQAE